MRDVNWINEENDSMPKKCIVNGLLFDLDYEDYTKKTTEAAVLLCKTARLTKEYIKLYSQFRPKRILELGIFEGGSALFTASLLNELERIVAVDIREFNTIVDNIISREGLKDRIKLFYETPQDSSDVKKIINENLGGRPDIIIDDCSHCYGPTKASFEMLFPLLAPGGLYIIEDWAWAHWPGYQEKGSPFFSEPALTNFIFELIALRGTRQDWFGDITFKAASMVVIQKGHAAINEPLSIEASTLLRGRKTKHI